MTPKLAWLGDDFTGSAAVMEVLAFAGLRTVLFSDIPSEALAARFATAQAVGIATTSRGHGPDWMRAHLPAPLAWLDATGAEILHYKVCSTFDSAPHVGSIGRAAEIGLHGAVMRVWPFIQKCTQAPKPTCGARIGPQSNPTTRTNRPPATLASL